MEWAGRNHYTGEETSAEIIVEREQGDKRLGDGEKVTKEEVTIG